MTRRPTPATGNTTTIYAAILRGVLDLSTAHPPENLGDHERSGHDGVTAYELLYGWLTRIPTDPQANARDHHDLTVEVLAIQRDARGSGRDHLPFDAVADLVGDAPTWDW